MLMKKFTLPTGCSVAELVLRETTGEDEILASSIAEAKGKGSTVMEEMLRLSIVKVDGEKITQPYEATKKWNSKTRSLLLRAYVALNHVEDKEDADFLSGAEPVAE